MLNKRQHKKPIKNLESTFIDWVIGQPNPTYFIALSFIYD